MTKTRCHAARNNHGNQLIWGEGQVQAPPNGGGKYNGEGNGRHNPGKGPPQTLRLRPARRAPGGNLRPKTLAGTQSSFCYHHSSPLRPRLCELDGNTCEKKTPSAPAIPSTVRNARAAFERRATRAKQQATHCEHRKRTSGRSGCASTRRSSPAVRRLAAAPPPPPAPLRRPSCTAHPNPRAPPSPRRALRRRRRRPRHVARGAAAAAGPPPPAGGRG
eukprot:gene12541-biopygen6455